MKPLRIGVAGWRLFRESQLGAVRAIPETEVVAVYDPNQQRATGVELLADEEPRVTADEVEAEAAGEPANQA